MNLVFIIGKVIEKVEFKFIYKSKYISVATTRIELSNDSIVKVVGYDLMADYMYRKINIDNKIFIYGEVNNLANKNMCIKIIKLKV